MELAQDVLKRGDGGGVVVGWLPDDRPGRFDGVSGAFGLDPYQVQLGVAGWNRRSGDDPIESLHLAAGGVPQEHTGRGVGRGVKVQRRRLGGSDKSIEEPVVTTGAQCAERHSTCQLLLTGRPFGQNVDAVRVVLAEVEGQSPKPLLEDVELAQFSGCGAEPAELGAKAVGR